MRILLAALLAPTSALAIGMCEGLSVDYQLTHVAADGRYVVLVDEETCAEGDGGEVRAQEKSARVYSADGTTIARFCATPAEGCAALKTLGAWAKSKGLTPIEKIEPVRKTSGAFPVEKRGGPLCDVGVQSRAVSGDGEHPLNAVTLTMRFRVGKPQPLARFETAPEASGARLVVLPDGTGLLSLATAVCGGPPPGYFGEDDGGDCMPDVTHAVRRVPRSVLGACVGGVAPKAPASKASPSAPPAPAKPAPASR